jgi:hypothetical protein
VTEEVPGRSSVEVRGLAANEYGNPADDGTEDNLTRVPVNYESSLVIYHNLYKYIPIKFRWVVEFLTRGYKISLIL